MATSERKKIRKKKRKRVFRTTKLQRLTLKKIRTMLAESFESQIFPVAPWFRRHSRDFISIPCKLGHMLLVRPTRWGGIEIRTYAGKEQYTRIRVMLEAHKSEFARIRWYVWLPTTNEQTGWKKYVSTRYYRAIRTFTDFKFD